MYHFCISALISPSNALSYDCHKSCGDDDSWAKVNTKAKDEFCCDSTSKMCLLIDTSPKNDGYFNWDCWCTDQPRCDVQDVSFRDDGWTGLY